jgi:hypothetical protein
LKPDGKGTAFSHSTAAEPQDQLIANLFFQLSLRTPDVALVLAVALTSAGQPLNNVTNKHAEMPTGTEVAKSLARFGDLTLTAIRERLRQMRPQAYAPGELLLKRIIEAQGTPAAQTKLIDQDRAALQSVLDYHARRQMPILVVESEQPRAALVDRIALVITTRLINMASPAELRGIVAYELAHEYLWQEHEHARQTGDENLMRECDLFCDVVAAFTLKELGNAPVG